MSATESFAEAVESAKRAAMHALRYRFRSEEELRKRLTSKGFEDRVVDEVMARLRSEGWLDDFRFASEVVRATGRRWGRVRIERKLRQMGVDPETAERALTAVPEEDRKTALEDIVEKKLREMQGRDLDPDAARRRLAGFLERRGFEAGIVRETIFSIDWTGMFRGNDPSDDSV